MESTNTRQSSSFLAEQSFRNNSKNSGRLWKLINKIMSFECPYLESLEENVVKEIVFSEGEARIRLLYWLVGRFHQLVKDSVSLNTSKCTDSSCTVPELTGLLADMGLCSRQDYELVKGVTSMSRQLSFLEALVDIVQSLDPTSNHLNSLNRLDDKMESCCGFVDSLCRSEELDDVFPCTLALVPPAIAKATSLDQANKSIAGPPSSAELRDQIKSLNQQLEQSQTELNQITTIHSYEELDLSALENVEKSLSVNLETLHQLSTNFCHVFESEIQPWTDRRQPELTALGPMFRRINTHRTQVDKLLNSVDLLTTSSETLEKMQKNPSDIKGTNLHVKEVLEKHLLSFSQEQAKNIK